MSDTPRKPLWRRIQKLLLGLHTVVKAAEPWGILLAVIGFGFTIWTFAVERADRSEDRINRALANFVNGIGRVDAMAVLVRNGVSLVGLKAPEALLNEIELVGVDLSGADFSKANFAQSNLKRSILKGTNFSGASLSGANFRFAYLFNADFSDASLVETDLSGANLEVADFSNTIIVRANFSNTSLYNTNFRNAEFLQTNFRGAKGFEGVDFAGACADEDTVFPKELQLPPCSWHSPLNRHTVLD